MRVTHVGRSIYLHVTGTPEEPFVEEAYYEDTGDDCPEHVIEEIERWHAGEIAEAAYQNCVMQAEYAFEGDR